MKKIIYSSDSIYASSFSRAISQMNRFPCGFITAFRRYDSSGNENSMNENHRRNKLLEADIRASGLTYIRATGGYVEHYENHPPGRVQEDTFCVIDNRFPESDFVALMVDWCGKYEQNSVLVTFPRQEQSGKAINVIGVYYDSSGNQVNSFNNATIRDAEDYFTSICGKDFVLSSSEEHVTRFHYGSSVSSRVMGSIDFRDLYPELKKNNFRGSRKA